MADPAVPTCVLPPSAAGVRQAVFRARCPRGAAVVGS